MTTSIRTTCPYCGVGCGITATQDHGSIQFSGDKQHPANFGRLCSKGAAVGDTLSLENRLLYPQIQGRQVDWDQALAAVADGFQQVIAEYGPDAVAFYLSGQLLTEDYYVANKLMKGFIGSANVDTNSRLCMSSSVAGHKRAFGEDVVPGNYEDLEQADLIVLVGSNLAWCHPVLYQRIRAARESNPQLQVVVVDPRRTATCDLADMHLAIKPGSDTALFNGLLNYLHQHDQLDTSYIAAHTNGFDKALASAQSDIPPAARCGVASAVLEQFYAQFAKTEKTVTVYSQGVNQSSYGTDKVNAIINCHLATGRVGKLGSGPFSVTGQPNAMGGREVGGLANTLAAHRDFDAADIDSVGRFWQAERMASTPGLKAVDLFQAVGEGRIKALWIMATNPVVSLPDADSVRAALKRCPLVVVSEVNANTDTAAYADILLPALAWGEKDGTVTNSERRISRQRALLPLPGEARSDWWIVTQVAQRMGFEQAFPYESPDAVFREHAALSGFENDGARAFDISSLANLSPAEYDALEPLQWPVPANQPNGTTRLFGDGFYTTTDRRARFIAIDQRQPVNAPDAEFPLILNTGRIRDQWHTMTRTGKSARLSAHTPEPYAELHPVDAVGIDDGKLIKLKSRWGQVLLRARLNDGQQPGSVFVPMHWSQEYAATGCIDAVVNPVTDPFSGQPESKHTPVCIMPYRPVWYGFVLSREPLNLSNSTYRVSVRGDGYWRYELAGETQPADWGDWARSLSQVSGWQWLDYADHAAGRYRAAAIAQERLQLCAFIAPQPLLPPREWLGGLFGQATLEETERLALLAGRAATQNDAGPIVCSCFQVGLNTLTGAIREQGLVTTKALGETLRAGTNCGSCLPELRGLIAQCQPGQAA
ncbi:MAG: nitrate reductase [Candidatus Competibacteraceae bacterium]|nr:nitrate reductase [Candidatus Competibacteraceae bacterium]